jgi:hypothetical protein
MDQNARGNRRQPEYILTFRRVIRIFDVSTSPLFNSYGIERILDVGTEEQLCMIDSGTRRLMRQSFLLVLLFSLSCISCENNPFDAIDTRGSAPFLQSATITPAGFDLDLIFPPGASYTLNASLSALVSDAQGAPDVAAVSFVLLGPSSDVPLASGQCAKTLPPDNSQPVVCSGALTFSIDQNATGIYRLTLSALDQAGHVSATLLQEIPVFRGTSAPVLSQPGARILALAGTDSTRYAITVAAFDANGLKDIAQVSVRAIGARNATPMTMYDDGVKVHFDATAGDGIYSIPSWVSPTGDIHDVIFEFLATDRAGHASNVIRRPVANATPRFTSFNVPATITRPASGNTTVTFSLTVADDDGLADIDSVYFRNMSSTSPTPFLLYDDGDMTAHGDPVAHDGSYASILQISSTNTPGVKLFQFSVTDRLGARADSTKNITIN